MKTKKIICAVAFLAAALAISSCQEGGVNQQSSAKSYKTMVVSKGNTSVSTKYSTSIRGEEFVDIRPQVSGVITKIAITEGAKVKKGDVMFVIDQLPYQAALGVAEANVKSAESVVATAKLNAESSQELFDAEVISENELQTTLNTLASAEAALALAKAQLTIARSDLSYTVITSPVDGVASMIPYRVGALVSSSISDPLVSVAKNDNMYAYFSMSESQLLALTRTVGSADKLMDNMDEVELILNDGVGYEHMGKVDAISGTIDSSTGTVGMRAIFANPDYMLRDGGSGSIVITTLIDDAIVVPKIATFEIQNKVFAYKVVDGVTRSSQLEIYPYNNGREYVVLSGLEVGDVIIAEGAGLLRENTPVANAETKE
ncbi:MAG: efflux RND transporter periplasmic adaptor subunit [Rikenellaceae bacterium]